MFLLGIISLCQLLFIPGYLVTRFLGISDGIIKTVLLSFSLSLVINHYLVVILTTLNSYNRPALAIILTIEIVLLCWLSRNALTTPLSNYVDILHSRLGLPWNKKCFHTIDCFVAISLVYFSFQFFTNIGNVFDGWDPVMSWNRWAIDWYGGKFPRLTWHYPQLLPSAWSMTYIFLGTQKIQFFATAIMPLFPLFSLLSLFDLWKRKNESAYGYAIPSLALIYIAFLYVEINKGYADFPVAFMAFMAIYILLRLDTNQSNKYMAKHLLLGIICCAGTALTKQAGLYLVAVYPLLCHFTVIRNISNIKKIHTLYVGLISYVLLICLVAPWYLFVNDRISKGLDQSEVPYVTNEIYKGADLRTRVINSFGTVFNDTTTNFEVLFQLDKLGQNIFFQIVTITCFMTLVFFVYRGSHAYVSKLLFVLIAVPFYIIWCLYFSYGVRNLAMILPVIGVIAGHGIAVFDIRVFKRIFLNRSI